MKRFVLARKIWPLALCCAAFVVFELALYFTVTRNALEAFREGRAYEGAWGWTAIAGWHAAIALACAALAWQPLNELRTFFNEEGVGRSKLFGPTVFVSWAEAQSVFVAPLGERPYLVKIKGADRSLELNALFYKEPTKLLALIEERMKATLPENARGASDARRVCALANAHKE